METKIKKWKKRESLESLTLGQVAQMCDSASYIDGHFYGLYIGKDNEKFVFLSRCIGEKLKGPILRWRLSGKGYVDRGYFLFDGFEEKKIESIKEDNQEYQSLNEQLVSHTL